MKIKMKLLPRKQENSTKSNESIIRRMAKLQANLLQEPVFRFVDFIPEPRRNNNDEGSIDTKSNDLHKKISDNLQETTQFLGCRTPSSLASSCSSSSSSKPTSTTTNTYNEYSIMDMDPDFKSAFHPNDMRLLALVSHNNMKDAMREFVIANKNVLKKFRLTGTNTTMTMLKKVLGDDPDIVYGPSCVSGPLGGDAQLVAMAATGQLGGCIFFIDPMDAHPHSADIDCLCRQGNVHNILMMNNPNTAHVTLNALRLGLKLGRIEMMPSFFFDLESPSVKEYKSRQESILVDAIRRRSSLSLLSSINSNDSTTKQIDPSFPSNTGRVMNRSEGNRNSIPKNILVTRSSIDPSKNKLTKKKTNRLSSRKWREPRP